MSDFLVKVLGTFLIAGVTAAAGAIIEEMQNFGKSKIGTKPLVVQDWKHFMTFNKPAPAATPTPAPTSYTAPTRPAYTPPAIPTSEPYKIPTGAYRP